MKAKLNHKANHIFTSIVNGCDNIKNIMIAKNHSEKNISDMVNINNINSLHFLNQAYKLNQIDLSRNQKAHKLNSFNITNDYTNSTFTTNSKSVHQVNHFSKGSKTVSGNFICQNNQRLIKEKLKLINGFISDLETLSHYQNYCNLQNRREKNKRSLICSTQSNEFTLSLNKKALSTSSENLKTIKNIVPKIPVKKEEISNISNVKNQRNKDSNISIEEVDKEYSNQINLMEQYFKNERKFERINDKDTYTKKKLSNCFDHFMEMYKIEERTGMKFIKRNSRGYYNIFEEKEETKPFFFNRSISLQNKKGVIIKNKGIIFKESPNLILNPKADKIINKCKKTIDKSTRKYKNEFKRANTFKKNEFNIFKIDKNEKNDRSFIKEIKEDIIKERKKSKRLQLKKLSKINN